MSELSPARYARRTGPSKTLRCAGGAFCWSGRRQDGVVCSQAQVPGPPETFSDAAIQFCLSIKVLFGMALLQATGMLTGLLRRADLEDWPVPDFSMLCRRQKTVSIQIPYRRAGGPLHLLVDSTGVTRRGDGEWRVRRPGSGRRRQGQGPPAMDVATGDIRAVELTSSREGDSPVRPSLLAQLPPDQAIGTVTADGACGTRRCHTAIAEHGATAIIPIRKNGRAWNEACPAARARNETLRASRHFDRALWKRLTGYHARRRIEAQMRRLKSFGERIASRDPDRQAAEIHTRIALMNRFSALGRAGIARAA